MIGRRLSHYVLLDRLAKGGMGEVYRARDTVLEREVALKILPDELAEDPVLLERFELEAKAVAGLNHPNIVTLHSVEQVGGVKFLTMELIEGETLAERIPEGGMELEEFFDIAIQVTRGMEAAHAGGIVHRDLKPLNVMIGAEGRVKILDFGLAIEEEAAAAAAKTPASGRILGSIPYMSPEHLRAEPVRATSDVFALGVMFFEMLAGFRPFRGPNRAAVVITILEKDAPRLEGERPDLPKRLCETVRRCLGKDPAQRFSDAGELRRELEALRDETAEAPNVAALVGRRRALSLAAVAVVLLGVGLLVGRLSSGSGVRPIAAEEVAAALTSVAVMPFANPGGEAEDEYFSDGMTEELIHALVQVPGLRVPARTSVFALAGRDLSAREIGERLGVETLLEGSVRSRGGRIRISVRLVDAAHGFQLWSEVYERSFEDVFAVQQEIARAIVARLAGELGGAAAVPVIRPPTESLTAYRLYLRGRFFWNQRTEEGLNEAIALFRQAIAEDPSYALAWAGLADAWLLLPFSSDADLGEALGESERAAERALDLDPGLAEPHASLGLLTVIDDENLIKARNHFKQALELDPSYATAHHWFGIVQLNYLDEVSAGLKSLETARRLDPLALSIQDDLVGGYLSLGRVDDAAGMLREMRELHPEWSALPEMEARLAFSQRHFGEVVEILDPFRRAGSLLLSQWDLLSLALHLQGHGAGELEAALEVRERYPQAVAAAALEARARIGLGEVSEAEKLLGAALDMPIDPRAPDALLSIAAEFATHGRLTASRRAFERIVDWLGKIDSSRPMGFKEKRIYLAHALAGAGRLPEAATIWAELAGLSPERGLELGYPARDLIAFRGLAAAVRGEAAAVEIANALIDREVVANGENLYQAARIAALAGDDDRALRALREAWRQDLVFNRRAHADSLLIRLYDDPRYGVLARGMGMVGGAGSGAAQETPPR